MDIDTRIAQVRTVMLRGEKTRAVELATGIVSDYPLADTPLLLLADLANTPQEALDLLLRARILNPANPAISARIQALKQTIARKLVKIRPEPKRRRRKKTDTPGAVPGSLNHPSIKPRRTRKPSPNKVYGDHEYDALDNAVYFNETSGVAMIKASRKKSGGRR